MLAVQPPPERYFDHAATTPLDPRALEEMLPFMGTHAGNASSLHDPGRRARAAVEAARESVAELLGAEDPQQVVFTSGATESNNWICNVFGRIAVSPFEHSSMSEPCAAHGAEVLRNDGYMLAAPSQQPELVSVICVSNETGAVLDLSAAAGWGYPLHSDVSQALGKMPLPSVDLGYASCSAHKLYGPMGVGALYIKEGIMAQASLGGGQEGGLRSGTLNVPGIVGFGAAARIAADEMPERMDQARALRDALLQELGSPAWLAVVSPREASPYILALSIEGILGESLVIELDRRGFAISAGAACSSGSTEASPSLVALGLGEERARSVVRISFGRANTLESAADLARAMRESVTSLLNSA